MNILRLSLSLFNMDKWAAHVSLKATQPSPSIPELGGMHGELMGLKEGIK